MKLMVYKRESEEKCRKQAEEVDRNRTDAESSSSISAPKQESQDEQLQSISDFQYTPSILTVGRYGCL